MRDIMHPPTTPLSSELTGPSGLVDTELGREPLPQAPQDYESVREFLKGDVAEPFSERQLV